MSAPAATPAPARCDDCGAELDAGVTISPRVCLDCFMGRPFKRQSLCPLCSKVSPIVRQYMNGPACDPCQRERSKGWRQ